MRVASIQAKLIKLIGFAAVLPRDHLTASRKRPDIFIVCKEISLIGCNLLLDKKVMKGEVQNIVKA